MHGALDASAVVLQGLLFPGVLRALNDNPSSLRQEKQVPRRALSVLRPFYESNAFPLGQALRRHPRSFVANQSLPSHTVSALGKQPSLASPPRPFRVPLVGNISRRILRF